MCGAPDQQATVGRPVAAGEAVIAGTVTRAGRPLGGAYVRLLDGSGDFTAEVVASRAGGFRFFARAGVWTLRGLAPGASGEVTVEAVGGEQVTTELVLSD